MNRRDFHKTSSALLLTYLTLGKSVILSPAAAQEQGLAHQILTPEEARLLALLGEAIVPGAQKAGLSHYIDYHLNLPQADSLLILKYLGVQGPFRDFYRPALRAFKESCPLFREKDISHVLPQDLTDYVAIMAQENPPNWPTTEKATPPAPFFYFVLRSDAIDVTYGTMAGFDKLDIPYMAHIEPEGMGWS
jgi:hypothetical protein